MRLLLALLLVTTTAFAAPFESESSSKFENLPNFYPSLEESTPVHIRAKRAVFAALGLANSCEAGWTGQNCENPICSIPGEHINRGLSSLIELLFLKGSCGGSYYIPVDADELNSIQIHVSASGVPYVNLTNAAGVIVPPSYLANGEGYALAVFADLPGGGYSLSIDNGNVATSECIVEVNSDSSLQVTEGFVYNPQSDDAPYSESAINGVPMYFAAHVHAQNTPSKVSTVTIRQGNSLTPVYRSVLTRRYNCGYEYYAGLFQCTIGNTYYWHVDGIDYNGYAFRRTGRFSCLDHITQAPPSTTTPAPITSCYNNGTLLTPAQGSATCFCKELFTGRQCEQPNCMNAGFLDQDGKECACSEGYHGPNCADVICPLNWENLLTDYKTLIVVIHDTASMNQYRDAISKAISSEISNNQFFDYDVYKGFVLVKYANGVFTNKYYPAYSSAQFLADLNVASTVSGQCSEATFDALASIFTDVAVYSKSPIYWFTDVTASDVDGWQTIVNLNTVQKYPIYTHFFPQSSCNFDDMDNGFQAIQYTTYYSGGLVLLPTASSLQQIFQNVLQATAYKMNTVLMDDMLECSAPSRVFFVDSTTSELIIIATGANLAISVTDPNGATNTLLPILNQQTTNIWQIPNPVIGEHILTLITTGTSTPCSFRVQARSEYDLFLGTSSGVMDDASNSEPVFGQSTHFVAQLSGLKNNVADPFRLFSEISITSNVNVDNIYQKPMYYSSGKYRNGCGFHLYFGAGNICDFANQPFYATVYADDGRGYTIQRTTVGFCSAVQTTPTPPNTCLNGGVFDPNNNQTCICPPNYGGRFCQNIQCTNGGTPVGGMCQCPVGTGGTWCEQYVCTSINGKPDISYEGQSLAFVISTRSTMKASVKMISDNIQTLTRDAQSASDKWINRWILIAINQNTSHLLSQADHPADFVQAVHDLYNNFDQYVIDTDNCQVQIEQGLLGAALLSERRSSVWAFTDSDGPNDLNYVQLYQVAEQYQISLNLVGTGSSICTTAENNGQYPTYLKSLADITMGQIYMTSQLDKILLFIISLYKSSVSHRYYVPDCTKPTSYYMPVDGWTQSLTLSVTGTDLNGVSVTFPDGTLGSNSDYEIVSINDPELKLNQYVAACDGQFWNYHLQNCYQYNTQTVNWYDSWSKCHDENAFMVHIENQDINDMIFGQVGGFKVWIGLVFINGKWTWDVPDGNVNQPLAGYTNWADGVDPNNPSSMYAIMNENGKWEPAPSAELYFPVCQKHRYGQGLSPGESVNIVPAGLWKVTVQSNTGSCTIQARSQSEIQIFYGFSTNPRSDNPETYANINSNSNYLISLATGMNPYTPDTKPSLEGRLNYALLISNNTITNSLPLNNRLCTYASISAPFSCPDTEGSLTDFSIKFSGIDQYGYAFERYADALCSKTIINCANGGFLNNGVCVCRAGWAGQTCSTPVCQNGGIERNGKCDCSSVPQFGGDFCEVAFCEPPYPTTFNDKGRTLVIALETSYNMGSAIYQLKRNLKASLDSIKSDPTLQGWFSNYILYPFDSTSNKADWYAPVMSTNSDDIVAAVKNITVMSCPGAAPCSSECPRPIVGVVESILDLEAFAKPNSVIVFVSRSSPEDYTQVGRISRKLQNSKAYINFALPAIDSPCGMGWNTPAAFALYQITSYSQGNEFTLSSVDLSTNFLTKYIPTLYSSSGLSASSGKCLYDEIFFQVEHEMYEFSIDFYHPQIESITVYDPSGDRVTLPDNIISSDTNYIAIVPVNETGATRAGTYRVVLSGKGGDNCYAFVRGRSNLELYLGFVEPSGNLAGANSDAANSAPTTFSNSTIVVHANNLGAGVARYAQIVLPGYGLVHTTTLKKRSTDCSYEWYAEAPYEFQYDYYWVIIYGSSEYGSNWQRNFYVSSVDSQASRPPPPAFCDLSAVKQDTLFIIDSSANNITNTILKHFAAQAVQPYSYTDNKAQVAALQVADKAYGGFSFNAGENSYERVSNLLYGMQYVDTTGQNVTSALQYVLDFYDQPSQGYRNGKDVRHLLVYVTNTNPTDADPSLLLSKIKQSGLYEIVVIAFDMNASSNLLNMVNPHCYYAPSDYHELMNYGVNFVQTQSCLRFNFCSF